MSIAILVQANAELRRLAIAGSKLAKGDFRLKRLIEPLEQSGKKAPVFAKIAGELTTLLESTPKQSAEQLLKASTLVSAVLYTQGQTQVPGETEDLPHTAFQDEVITNTSSRRLRPILDAMRTTGSGRYEIIEEAFNDGFFRDLRLMRPALDHLEDSYSLVADLFSTQIIPSFGPKVVPYLREGLKLNGGRRDARALQVIHAIQGQEAMELLIQALDEGSTPVKVSAIEALAAYPSAVSFIKEHASAKNKEVRAAALEALGDQQGGDVVALLMAALTGKDRALAVLPILRNASPELVAQLLTLARTQFAALKKKDPAKSLITEFKSTLECLQGRTDEGSIALVRELLSEFKLIGKWKGANYVSGQDLLETLTECAWRQGDPETNQLLIENVLNFSGQSRGHAFQIMLEQRSPAEIYDWAMLALDKKSASAVKDLVESSIRYRRFHDHEDSPSGWADFADKWDPRWLDWALKNNNEALVFALARPDHPQCLKFLRTKLKTSAANRADDYLEVLIRAQGDDAFPLFAETVKRLASKKSTYMWGVYRLAEKFDPKLLPDLEKLAGELPDEHTLQLLDVIEPLIFNAQGVRSIT